MPAGIREKLIISTTYDLPGFKRLLVHDSACLVLGYNIFQGSGFTKMLKVAVRTADEEKKATVFGYWVSDPERYGVAA